MRRVMNFFKPNPMNNLETASHNFNQAIDHFCMAIKSNIKSRRFLSSDTRAVYGAARINLNSSHQVLCKALNLAANYTITTPTDDNFQTVKKAFNQCLANAHKLAMLNPENNHADHHDVNGKDEMLSYCQDIQKLQTKFLIRYDEVNSEKEAAQQAAETPATAATKSTALLEEYHNSRGYGATR